METPLTSKSSLGEVVPIPTFPDESIVMRVVSFVSKPRLLALLSPMVASAPKLLPFFINARFVWLIHEEPVLVRISPAVPGAMVCRAPVPLPTRRLFEARVELPVPPLLTGREPLLIWLASIAMFEQDIMSPTEL